MVLLKFQVQIEHVLAAGFVLLVPLFLAGVVATWFEHAVGLTLTFAGFGAAGLVWVRQELPAILLRLAEIVGLIGPPTT